MIDRNLEGIRLDPKKPKTSIVAYADDVTILIIDPSEVPLVQNAIKCYQEASGASNKLRQVNSVGGRGMEQNNRHDGNSIS
jgi:hypothetical protein